MLSCAKTQILQKPSDSCAHQQHTQAESPDPTCSSLLPSLGPFTWRTQTPQRSTAGEELRAGSRLAEVPEKTPALVSLPPGAHSSPSHKPLRKAKGLLTGPLPTCVSLTTKN